MRIPTPDNQHLDPDAPTTAAAPAPFGATEPAEMTPEDRLREVASILASGVRRLAARAALGGHPAGSGPDVADEREVGREVADFPSESAASGLEVPGGTPLHGRHG